MRARPVLAEVATGLRRNVTMTVAVVVTVGISLALFGVGLLLRAEVGTIDRYLLGRLEVVVDLNDGITPGQRAQLGSDLKADPLVAAVTYESKQQAFVRFKEDFKDSPNVTKGVDADALPAAFRVKMKDPHRIGDLVVTYETRDGVDQVEDQRDLLAPFFRLLSGFEIAAFALAAVQAAAAFALIYNLIRVSAFSRRRETAIMRLVGATRFTVQLPFVLESAAGGLAGGLAASGVIVALKVYLVDHRFAHQRVLPMFGWDTVWIVTAAVVVAGVVAPSVVSFATLRRHLQV